MPNPRIRRRARERAMQFLHGLDMTHDEWEDVLDDFWEAFPAKPGARHYARQLIEGVTAHRAGLDAHIDGALKNWSPKRVGSVERNLLRIALYEMAFAEDVPKKVAINEAVEIAKAYGGDEAPGFVNGVLDRLKDAELREAPAP